MIGNWFYTSKQAWKIYVFLTLSVTTVVVVAIALVNDFSGNHSIFLAGTSVSLSFTTFLWISTAIRCPRCKGRPVWFMIRSASASDWFTAVLRLERCPICTNSP